MTAARRKGIRSYVLTSYGHGCDNNQKKYMYLVIDNLQMSDQGSYTCFAVSKSLKVTNYTVTIIPGKNNIICYFYLTIEGKDFKFPKENKKGVSYCQKHISS